MDRLYCFLGGVVVALFAVYWVNSSEPAKVGQIAPILTGKEKVVQDCRKVVIYAKNVNKPLGVDPSLDVLTAVKTKEGTAIASLNQSGEATIHLRVDPKPWLARKDEYKAELMYGIMDGKTVPRVGFTWNLIQIKSLNLGFTAQSNLDTEKRDFVGASISLNW